MTWIILLVFAIICACIANSKGRNPVGWFIIGFLLGLIGLIICLCMSNLTEERQYRDQQSDENRRLREKLRQEQLKLESLRRHTADRLDQHDRALQMDTRSTEPALLASGYAYPAGQSLTPAPSSLEENSGTDVSSGWYFVENGQQAGPVTPLQLTGLIQAGQIQRDTFIWQPTMSHWAEAGTVQQFTALFS